MCEHRPLCLVLKGRWNFLLGQGHKDLPGGLFLQGKIYHGLLCCHQGLRIIYRRGFRYCAFVKILVQIRVKHSWFGLKAIRHSCIGVQKGWRSRTTRGSSQSEATWRCKSAASESVSHLVRGSRCLSEYNCCTSMSVTGKLSPGCFLECQDVANGGLFRHQWSFYGPYSCCGQH